MGYFNFAVAMPINYIISRGLTVFPVIMLNNEAEVRHEAEVKRVEKLDEQIKIVKNRWDVSRITSHDFSSEITVDKINSLEKIYDSNLSNITTGDKEKREAAKIKLANELISSIGTTGLQDKTTLRLDTDWRIRTFFDQVTTEEDNIQFKLFLEAALRMLNIKGAGDNLNDEGMAYDFLVDTVKLPIISTSGKPALTGTWDTSAIKIEHNQATKYMNFDFKR